MLFGDHIVKPPSRHAQQGPLIAQSACVVDQVPDRDLFAEVRHIRQVLAYVVIKREFSLIRQQRDGEGRKLFRNRRDMKHRLRCDGNVVFQVRASIAAFVDDGAVLDNRNCSAW